MARMQVVRPSVTGTAQAANKTETDTALTWVAGTAHKFLNDDKVVLSVKTGAGASQVMTVVSQQQVGGLSVEDREIDLTASTTELFGPFQPSIHNELSGTDKGYTSVKFNTVTGLEVTVIGLG